MNEYEKELVVDGAPPFSPKIEMYDKLEEIGTYSVLQARWDGKLIGFIGILFTIFPHCGIMMATSESYFVDKEYRRTGAGTRLRLCAEMLAKDRGSPGIFISAPYDGDLAKVLPRSGYRETSRVFFKDLRNVE